MASTWESRKQMIILLFWNAVMKNCNNDQKANSFILLYDKEK